MRTTTYLRSFAGGEIAPDMQGRVDSTAYQTGAARVRNMLVRPQGAVTRRPGTQKLATTKFNAEARLIPFAFSAAQTAVVEIGCPPTVIGVATSVTSGTLVKTGAGWTVNAYKGLFVECNGSVAAIASNTADTLTLTGTWSTSGTPTGTLNFVIYIGYFRFHVDGVAVTHSSAAAWSNLTTYSPGELVTDGGATWFARQTSLNKQPSSNPDYWYQEPTTGELELPNKFAATHLFELTYAQSFDVLTIAHPEYSLTELQRLGAQSWQHVNVLFGAQMSAPTGVSGAASGGVKLAVTSWATGSPPSGYSGLIGCSSEHHLVSGDVVYIAGTGVAALDGHYWLVETDTAVSGIDKSHFRVTDPATGAAGPTTGTLSSTGTAEVVPYNSIRSNTYAVTAVDQAGVESVASSTTSVTNNLQGLGAYNTVTWNRVTGAERYRVYKLQNGLLGLIGEVDDDGVGPTFSFRDDDIEPDLSTSPPVQDTTLSGADYPAAVAYFEQRRVFGGTTLLPQSLWLTRTGTEADLSYHIPVRDDDRISITLAALRVNRVRHIVPLNQLLVLTDSVEYRVSPSDRDALTPLSVTARPQSYVGASTVTPLVLHNTVLFVAARGNHVRELGFRLDADGFVTGDVSLRASHLFDNATIVDAALQKAPIPVAWFVLQSGELLSFTYLPDEQVGAWALHTTGDAVESVCVVPEGDEDAVYVVVRRVVNSITVRFVERFYPQTFDSMDTAVFLDCALEFTSVSSGSLGGLSHLEGEQVSIVADGILLQPQTVASGAISLAAAYDRVVVGLFFFFVLQTLTCSAQIPGYGQANTRSLVAVKARVVNSGPFLVGPDSDTLVSSDSPGDAPQPYADTTTALEVSDRLVPVPLPGQWGDADALLVQQPYPFPLTVVGLALEVALGGV